MSKPKRLRVASSLSRVVHKRAHQPDVEGPVTAPVSLPLQEAKQAESSSLPTLPTVIVAPNSNLAPNLPIVAPKPHWYLPEDSKVRETAVKIVMMESVAGMSREEIADTLGISPKSIAGYLYKAGKNGWLDFDKPKDQLEYTLLHKVIRNLDASLDSDNILQSGMSESTATALKIAEGALFPKMAVTEQVQASTLVGIKIEIVGGDPGAIREGTVMGSNRYIDVEPVE